MSDSGKRHLSGRCRVCLVCVSGVRVWFGCVCPVASFSWVAQHAVRRCFVVVSRLDRRRRRSWSFFRDRGKTPPPTAAPVRGAYLRTACWNFWNLARMPPEPLQPLQLLMRCVIWCVCLVCVSGVCVWCVSRPDRRRRRSWNTHATHTPHHTRHTTTHTHQTHTPHTRTTRSVWCVCVVCVSGVQL